MYVKYGDCRTNSLFGWGLIGREFKFRADFVKSPIHDMDCITFRIKLNLTLCQSYHDFEVEDILKGSCSRLGPMFVYKLFYIKFSKKLPYLACIIHSKIQVTNHPQKEIVRGAFGT